MKGSIRQRSAGTTLLAGVAASTLTWPLALALAACSCPGYWYRRTCKHYRAYAEAVALVLAQDAVNVTYKDRGLGRPGRRSVASFTDTCKLCMYR